MTNNDLHDFDDVRQTLHNRRQSAQIKVWILEILTFVFTFLGVGLITLGIIGFLGSG